MNVNEATRILRNSGFYCYRNRLGNQDILTEASAIGMLKKIPEVLKKFKERIQSGQGDKVKEDLESLKDEIQSKKVLSGFGNATMLKNTIFAAIAALTIACNDNNAGVDNAAATGTNTTVDAAFDQMENTIKAACGDSESCVVHTVGDRVTGGDGDGNDTFTWKLASEKTGKSGDHFYKIDIDQDNNGKTDMGAILHISTDGHIQHVKWLKSDQNKGEWEKANDRLAEIFPNVDKMIRAK